MKRFHICLIALAASSLLVGSAFADEPDTVQLAPAFDLVIVDDDEGPTIADASAEVVVEEAPDWRAIAYLLHEDRAIQLDDMLDKMTYVSEALRSRDNIVTRSVRGQVATVQQRLAGLWEVMANPYETDGELDSILSDVEPAVAYIDEFVGLSGIDDSKRVERKWTYAHRDLDDLRGDF